MSIFFLTISFYTVIMSFIMTILNDFNTILTTICKFSKRLIDLFCEKLSNKSDKQFIDC